MIPFMVAAPEMQWIPVSLHAGCQRLAVNDALTLFNYRQFFGYLNFMARINRKFCLPLCPERALVDPRERALYNHR
jgi:hypothetical protein